MIDYSNMPDENVASRRWGWVATTTYCVVIGLAMWLVQCDSRADVVEDASSGSLVISFGDVSQSSLESQKSLQQVKPIATPQPTPQPTPQLTDERSDIESPKQPEVVEEQPQQESETPQEVAEEIVETKPREINQRALFPGTSATKQSESEGSAKESPAKGVEGSDRGNPDERGVLGEGLTGNYSLSGRSMIGSLPVPSYTAQAEGRVVIAITVDEKGRVTTAGFQLASSTTNDSRLVKAAREAALKARFDQSTEFVQSGTITYIFKMN